MSLERNNYTTSFTRSSRRVSFSLPLNSGKELHKMENISKKKKDDNELKNQLTSGDSGAPKPSYSDLQEGSDECSSDDSKPSIHESDSVNSLDVSFDKKRKKKWKIKLPWKKKNKPTKEIFESPKTSENESSETEDGADGDSPSSASGSAENVSKSVPDLKPAAKKGNKRLAASWYGSPFNASEKKEDTVAGEPSTEVVMNPSKFGFQYDSSSSDSDVEIFPPSKPYHKRIQEKNKYLVPDDDEVSKSNPSLSEKDSKKESEGEKKSSVSESSYSVDEEAAGSKYSPKQQSPKIKKYYSLPSIFFRRNKKKKQKTLENQRLNYDEQIRDEQSSDDVDLPQQSASTSKNADIQKRIKTNSAYVETPLSSVGSEKPVLKSWSPKENIFEREYSNNVETVNSIFKRSSYKRVYGNRISASSVTYPPSKVTDEEKSTLKAPETLALETSSGKIPSPKTSSLKGSKKSSVKKLVNEIKSEIPEQRETVIKNKSQPTALTHSVNSNKENPLRDSKKKVIETKAEINTYTGEPKIKPLNEKTNVIESTSKEIKKNQGVAKSSVRKGKNKQSPKADILMVSKRDEAFDRTLERELKEAKKTVEDVNNQFGQSIFTRNYRTKKTSEAPISLTVSGLLTNVVNSTSQNKLKKDAKVSAPIIRRRSYEEMVNKIDEEMFDSDDESSDTDCDQIDLSFKKPHLDATVNFEIRKSTERLDDSDSDGDQHIYHIRVHKHEKPAPVSESKKSSVVVSPLSPITAATMVHQDKEKPQHSNSLITEPVAPSLPLKKDRDDSSHGYSSSSEDENEVIYANTKVKLRKLKKSKEINQLLDESIKKFVPPDSPPKFSPPPIIPEPKFSPGINDRLAYTNAIPSSKINQEDKVSANYIAKQLLLKREQQKEQLPIKNIKSYKSSESSLPPVPPSLPPPEDDPFWIPQKPVKNSSFVISSPNRLSVSHLPTISYSPTSEAESCYKPSKSPSVSSTASTKWTTKQLQPKYDSEFHEPQILSSPVLLKAELVDRGSKDKPLLEVKREFVGPYKVSPMRGGTQQDTRKQAVSFNIPLSKIDKDDKLQPEEQIYANKPNAGNIKQSAFASQSNPTVREEGVPIYQEENFTDINSRLKLNESKTNIPNVSSQYNTYPRNRAEYYSQQKLVNQQYISERNKFLSMNEGNNNSLTQQSQEKTSSNNKTISDEKKVPMEQIYANEPNPRLHQQFNSSQNLSMMTKDIHPLQEESSVPIELNKSIKSSHKKSYSHNWRNQFNEFPYNKVDLASKQTQDGLRTFPDRTGVLPIVQSSNIGLTHAVGTPLNYKITQVSHSEKTYQKELSTERFQSKNVSSNTVPKQRPPLKSILRNSQRNASQTPKKGLVTTEPSLPQEISGPSPTLQKSSGRERDNSATYFKEFDVERVKIDSASSDSGTPPAIPDYPPPPPRKMTEIQQIFIESLLQPNEASLYNNFTSNQTTPPYSPQRQSSKTGLRKETQNFGSPTLGQARSRAPYIDFSDSDFEPVRVTYSSLPIPHPFPSNAQGYQHHRNMGADFAPYWTDDGKLPTRMEMMERKENTDYAWNNIQDQFLHEQIYENCRLKTDV